MSLERLVAEIEARGKEELAREESRAGSEKAGHLAERERRIGQLRHDLAQSASADAARERAQRVAAAKLQARKLLYEAREKRMVESLGATRQLLEEFTESDEYKELLKRMLAAAQSQLGKDLKVSGRSEDAAVLKSVAGRAYVATPVEVLGGLVAETSDGARRLNLTFDELLRLREDKVRDLLGR